MKIIVAMRELPMCASIMNLAETIKRYVSTSLKTAPYGFKTSDIRMKFSESTSDTLQMFLKPHFMGLNMLDDERLCFVGAPGLYDHTEFDEKGRKEIEDKMKAYRCHTVFVEAPGYSSIIEKFLNKSVYECTQGDLDHFHLFKEYEEYNKRYSEKIIEVYEEGDVVWVVDHDLLLLPDMLQNIPVGISLKTPFSSLFYCIPFYERILKSILQSKYIEFQDKISKQNFELLAQQKVGFLVERTPYMASSSCGLKPPLAGFSRRGINKNEILKIQESLKSTTGFLKGEEKIILVPFDSQECLLGVEAYISELTESANVVVVFLNLKESDPEEQIGVLRLRSYLEINFGIRTMSFAPSCDTEFYSMLMSCDICHCKEVSEVCSFLNIPVIRSNPYDFSCVATEIRNKMSNRDYDKYDFSCVSCCDASTRGDIESAEWTSHFLGHFLSESGANIDGVSKAALKTNTRNQVVQIHVDDDNDAATSKIVEDFKKSKTRTLLLDYDGTIKELASHPPLAAPTPEIKKLLTDLNKICRVVICTGRKVDDADLFFPKEIEVFAEHGACHRINGEWKETKNKLFSQRDLDLAWRIAKFFEKRTPGSELERKKTGFSFHYRNVPQLVVERQARVLFELLKRLFPNNVNEGICTVEVRCSKKSYAVEYIAKDGFVLCAGDDVSDEEMLGVCGGYTIHVGNNLKETTVAKYSIESPREFRKLLEKLLG